ncbi:MAG TPA: hypothetical protein VG815_13115, partial [Chloroflexota bacterium]|nr:hypothetical protein [Chloroflexota bacterium]
MKKTTWLLSVLFVLVVLPLIGRRALAQSGLAVTLGSCSSGCVLNAAPDFATDVLNDPWYMNKPSDVTLDPAPLRYWMAGPNSPVGTVSSFNDAANGAVSQNGLPNAVGGTWIPGGEGLMLLHRGYYGFINPLRNGRQTPIDTNIYKKVSFKMRINRTEGIAQPAVFWYRHPYLNPTALGGEDYNNFVYNLGFNSSIGLPTAGTTLPPPGSITGTGYQIYTGDLSQASDCSTGFTHQCLNPSGGSWTESPVVSLEIAPIAGGVSQNTQVAFDWVRLTPADNAAGSAMKVINWSSAGSGTSTITVADRGTPPTVFTVARLPSGTFSYNWNYGVLPPGTYDLTVTRTGASGTMTFRINNPPLTSVTDPSVTDGVDFATAVRHDPWDMKEPQDIDNDVVSTADHLISKTFTVTPGGVNELVGVSDGQCVSNCGGGIPVGDPEVWLLANNTAVTQNRGVIDTTKYRYLTFNLQLDTPYSLGYGSVGRVGFGYSTTSPWHVAVTEPFAVFPVNNTYTIDLATLNVGTDQGIEASQGFPQAWNASTVNQLRIKPDEFGASTQFHLAAVSLTAMAAPTGSLFNIKFSATDADNDNLTVKLSYDTTRNPADATHRVLITSGLTGASTSYNWNTNSVPPGVYYIYAEAFDGTDIRGSYSNGPVNVTTPSSTP